ncbi:MAG: hypothetical protein JW839_05405 [Candidatus Lokiarchaeota archaeon]|nr:hypothetical protein [Candidatus Lokiarchaeota archaeon]
MHGGNKGLSITAMSLAFARLAFIYASPFLYADSPRFLSGPQVEFAGVFMSLLPIACTMLMAIGLWNWRSWRALLVIGGSFGVLLSSLFVHSSLLMASLPFLAMDMAVGSLKKLLPVRLRCHTGTRKALAAFNMDRLGITPKQRSIMVNAVLVVVVAVPLAFAIGVEVTATPEEPCKECIKESYPLANFTQRQEIFRSDTSVGRSFGVQIVRSYSNMSVDEAALLDSLAQIHALEDTMDFDLNKLLRILYIDQASHKLSTGTKQVLKAAILGCKYWYTEPGDDTAIYWTENHQILYHTAELLAGQLYPADVFTISGMTGQEHVDHAIPLIERWIGWKGQFGFTEWHSNVYLGLDVAALVNLVDFSNNTSIQTKAAMVLDLIGFDLACNYFRGIYATAHGRTYDDNVRGRSATSPAIEGTAELAWIFLGLGYHRPYFGANFGAVALSTTDRYRPPAVIEAIAEDAPAGIEHRSRDGITIDEGDAYGIGYTEEDLPFWWQMAGPVAPPTIEVTFATMEKYGIKPEIVCGTGIPEILRTGSALRGLSLAAYSELLSTITRGTVLGKVNTYTYRTNRYQLSGVQDRMKGYSGFQEHYWQASLDDDAYVFTCAPGGLGFRPFTGGWKPRTTLYKNVGVIQYDRPLMPVEGEIAAFLIDGAINMMYGERPYNHAYFPRWAFDEVRTAGKWTFGSRNGSYVALYSEQPTFWASDYDLSVLGRANAWIVELGSVDEHGTFQHFVDLVSAAIVGVARLGIGYDVTYQSPSRGAVHVAWDGPMTVNGAAVDLGDYPRYDNPYCYQVFNTTTTFIHLGGQNLTLDFAAGTRTEG